MWYLIVPPLVFLSSLWLLLWFSSKRAADPLLSTKLDALPAAGRSFFFFREELGLRLLERLTQHFKIFSLKLHNSFTRLARALRERRERLKPKKETPSHIVDFPQHSGSARPEPRHWWQRLKPASQNAPASLERAAQLSPETPPREAAVPPVTLGTERAATATPDASQAVAIRRPSLLRTATPPETPALLRRRRPVAQRQWSEEELIGRIATNPKDAQAYELLGDYYMDGENLEDAKACYRQVIKLLPLNREVKEKVRRLERLLTQRGR